MSTNSHERSKMSIASYFCSLNKEIRFEAKERSHTEFHNQLTDLQYQMNNCWAESTFRQNKYKFIYNDRQDRTDPKPVPFYSDFSPSEKDLNQNKGKLEIKEIEKILRIQSEKMDVDVPQLSTSLEQSIIKSNAYYKGIPKNFFKPTNGYLNLSIGKCTIDKSLNVKLCGGFFQLLDFEKEIPLSEPVSFKINNGNAIFEQTIAKSVNFQIENKNQNLTLLCVLKKEEHNNTIPVAYTVIKLYDNENNFVFTKGSLMNWINLKDWSYSNFSQSSDLPRTLLPISFEMEIQQFDDLDCEFSYSWSKSQSNNYLVSSYPYPFYLPIPLISISGISLQMKISKKISHVYFIAYILESEINIRAPSNCLELFLNGNKLSNSFKSLAYQVTDCPIYFIDYISIYVDHKFKKNSHVLIQIMGVNRDKQEDTNIGTIIIPLFNQDKNPNSFEAKKFKVFETSKKQPKEILKSICKKESSKKFFQCNVYMPPAYFPPAYLKNMKKAVLPEQALPPSSSLIPQNIYKKHIIPVTTKLLKLMDPNSFIHLMQFYDNFEHKFVWTIVRFWIFHIMDPTLFGANFIDKLCKSALQVMKDKQEDYDASLEDIKIYINQVSFVLPLIFDIILVSISMPNSQFSKTDLIEFLKLIPRIIGRCCNKSYQYTPSISTIPSFHINNQTDELLKPPKNAVFLNEAFSNFICLLMPKYLLFKDVNSIVFECLNTFSTMKKHSSTKIYFTYLQFDFMLPFTYNQFFFANLALSVKADQNKEISPYLPVMSLVFKTLYQALGNKKKKSEKLLNIEFDFLLQLVITFEDAPEEITKKLSFILFPLIDFFILSFSSNQLSDSVKMKLIPILFFIMLKSEPSRIVRMFTSGGTSYQLNYLRFINTMVTTTTMFLDKVHPTYQNPTLLMTFFDYLTKNIIMILFYWIEHLGEHLKYVVLILKNLYNIYQPKSNISVFSKFCYQISNKYPCERDLVTWGLNLLTFRQHMTRCFGAAMLINIFKADFDFTGTVIISSVDMMDSLTSILLDLSLDEIPIYNLLLERLINIVKIKYENELPIFVRLLKGRLNAAKTIFTIVETQKKSDLPPDIKCQNLMVIADQYKIIPSMRLKWLHQIVNVNKEFENHISAFVTQLHIVALVETVIQEINNFPKTAYIDFYSVVVQPIKNSIKNYDLQHQLNVKNDFSFIPSALIETEIQLQNLIEEESAQILLSDFTMDLLIKELDTAIEIGKKAFMFYSLRPLYSLQLRLYQSSRNFNKIAEISRDMGESFGKIQTKTSSTYDLPMSFYLVENRGEDGKKEQKVFVTSNFKSLSYNFLSLLNIYHGFNGKKAEICENHTDKCTKSTVCVVHLIPAEEPNQSQEYRHAWNRFVTIPSLHDKNEITFMEYKTNEYLPQYRWASSVISSNTITLNPEKYVNQRFRKALSLLNQVAAEFEIWFPIKEEQQIQGIKPKEGEFTSDINRISDVLSSTLKGNDSFTEILLYYKDINPSETLRMSKEIRKAIIRCIAIYKRAVNNIQSKQAHEQLLPFIETIADDFVNQFGLDPIPNNVIFESSDPMEDGIVFLE